VGGLNLQGKTAAVNLLYSRGHREKEKV
jgi:hypothetical protein